VLIAACSKQLGTLALDLDLQVPAGGTFVLAGENGAGKTTILNLLAGLVHPDRGEVRLGDAVYFDSARGIAVPAHERSVGYVVQDYALFPHLSVFENVAFGLRAQGWRGAAVRGRVESVLSQFALADLASQRPARLSGGQQQRVALARALVLEPQLLLLDEPLSALDAQTRREVRSELRRTLAGLSCVTVLVTHSAFEAMVFGDRIAVLERGRIVQAGVRQDLLQQPRSRYVAELMGLNFFEGHVVARSDDGLAEVATDGGRLHIAAPADTGELLIAVDPREITLHLAPPSGSAQNIFAGTITQLVPELPLGDRLRVLLDTQPPLVAEITAHAAHVLGLREGMRVYASFKAVAARAYA
jgi:molybdate transport system ATP-binding protein